MTIKLYDNDAYLNKFEAKVTYCEKCNKGFKVILNQTAFFPEEGGQCCDGGTINGENVDRVEIENGIIYHYLKKELKINESVEGIIDFNVRFRNMQNHSAEHIISGIINKLYNLDNVGFHLGTYEVTADFNAILSAEDINKVEYLANKVIYENNAIKSYYPNKEELSKLDFRSKKEIDGDIRIVEIENCDICACCAPHVKSCGEIGVVKIIDFMKHRGGTRISFLAGYDAYFDYVSKSKEALKISNLLCAKQNKISLAVENLIKQRDRLKFELNKSNEKIAEIFVGNIENTNKNIVICESDLSNDLMQQIANSAKEKCKIICVVTGNEESGYRYIVSSKTVNLKTISDDIKINLNAKGGGSGEMIAGIFNTSIENIRNYFLT